VSRSPSSYVQDIHLYVKEIRGKIHLIGLLPRKDIFDLGSRSDPQLAIHHALSYARLLGVSEDHIHVFGKTVTELLEAGLEDTIPAGYANKPNKA